MEPCVTLRPGRGIAAGLLLLGLGFAGTASAQPVGFVFATPNGPTVLPTDGDGRVLVPAQRPDLAVPPVPVPHVMNGGGFGFTGFDYYNDQVSEGRLGARGRPREFVIAPAYVGPLHR